MVGKKFEQEINRSGGSPQEKKHYSIPTSKDKSVSAGMGFKKNSIGKSFAILPEAPQRSKTNSGEMTKPHTYQKRRSPNAYINVRAS